MIWEYGTAWGIQSYPIWSINRSNVSFTDLIFKWPLSAYRELQRILSINDMVKSNAKKLRPDAGKFRYALLFRYYIGIDQIYLLDDHYISSICLIDIYIYIPTLP